MSGLGDGIRRTLQLRHEEIPLRRMLAYLRPHRGRALVVLACIAAGSLLSLAPALVVKVLVDELARREPSFARVAGAVAAGLLAAVVAGLLGVARTYLLLELSTDVVARLRRELFDHLSGQSVGYFTANRSGDLMSRMLNDVAGIETSVVTLLVTLVANALTAAAALVLAFVLDWRLSLIALLVFPVIALALRQAGGGIVARRAEVQSQYAELTAYLQEVLSLSGMMLVKSSSRESTERERFAGLNRELRRRVIAAGMASRWFGLVLELLLVAGPAVLFLAGGWLVVHGETTLGSLLAFVTVAGLRFGPSIQGVGNGIVGVLGALPSWTRIFAVLDTPHELVERPGARPLRDVRGQLSLRDVSFSYPGAGAPAVVGVSVDVAAGSLVALVGPSGAGKTTLTSLVARFQDPSSGTVRIDGHDLRDVTLESLHRSLGMVLQETYLFHGTLRDNLRYARPDADDAAIAAAARAAHLDELVARLPEGYETLVGERGHRLSGGERQRLAIARVVLKDAPLLILDEATAHLDSVSERLIQSALGELFAGRTTIAIAHRLSTVVAADLILVLDAGQVVERGTHPELLAAGGLYARLHHAQFAAGAVTLEAT